MLDASLSLSVTIWDKDRIGKDFMGLLEIVRMILLIFQPISDLGTGSYDECEPTWFPLAPRSYKDKISGDVLVQFGFIGDLDDSMKKAIQAFAELNLVHARIVTTDDPADDVYFNNQVLDTTLLDQSAFESSGDISESAHSSSKLQHESLMGLLTVEISGATNLPMQKNLLRTTFNCDPFTVMSFGRKTFKTRLIRHSLNPNWYDILRIDRKERILLFARQKGRIRK
jgi:phosphatidylserine decarboxylase